MHLWVSLALIAPLLFAISNYIDKYLLNRIIGDRPVAVVTFLTGWVSVPSLLIMAALNRHALTQYDVRSALAAMLSGALLTVAFYGYYRALNLADASVVATLFQLIVVFNYVLGLLFLHEGLALWQIMAAGLVVAGSIALTLESAEKKLRINWPVLLWASGASLLIAASDVLFKFIARNTAYWPTQVYEYAGGIAAGMVLIFHTATRTGTLNILRQYRMQVVKLMLANEAVYVGGIISLHYALFLAPVAIVQAVSSVQAVYLLVLGILLTVLFPHIIKENITSRRLLQKTAAIVLIVTGTTVLALFA